MKASDLGYFVAGAIAAVIAGAALKTMDAQAARPSTSLTQLSPEDYIEIQQLYGMYARDVDPGSARDASWMFTKDATAVMDSYKTVKGADAIKDWYLDVQKKQRNGVRHFNSSYVIVGTPDGGARGSSYMMQVSRKSADGKPEVDLFGKYEDKLVKTPDGWRIKERVWRADTFRDDTITHVMASPVPGDAATLTTEVSAKAATP
jgi:hypothetical protein